MMASENPAAGKRKRGDDSKDSDSNFECNICLDTAKEAVISFCGHLFCWPCLHKWLETQVDRQVCPVCKAGISKDKVIPLYGRGDGQKRDPRDRVPPRPAGQRSEPEGYSGYSGFNQEESYYTSVGIGAFPFTFFSFNFGERRGINQHNPALTEEHYLSKILIFMAVIFILWIFVV